MKWKATFDDAQLLKRLVSALSKILSTANLKIREDSMVVSGMDESRIAMASLKSPNSFFQEFEFESSGEEEEEVVGINVSKLKDVMKRARSEDGIIFSLGGDSNKLRIKFFRGTLEESQFERIFSIPLTEETGEEVEPEKLEYSVRIEFAPPKDLSAVISDAAVFAEDLKIITDLEEKKVKFIAESGIGSQYEYVAQLKKEESIINYEIEDSAESMYSIEFLEDFNRADRVSEMVRMEYSNDNPLKLTYNIPGGATLTYLLAPRVV